MEKLLPVAHLMAQELQEFVDSAIEASGDPDALMGTQNLLWDWETAHSNLLKIIHAMIEKGYSVAIMEPHYCEPEQTYLCADYDCARTLAGDICEEWGSAMPVVNFYFLKDDEKTDSQDWLRWIPGNNRGEQVSNYTAGGDLAAIVETAP